MTSRNHTHAHVYTRSDMIVYHTERGRLLIALIGT